MLQDVKIIELLNDVQAAKGDALIIKPDGQIEVLRRYALPGHAVFVAPSPGPIQWVSDAGALTGESILRDQPRRRSRRFTAEEHQFFRDLVLEALKEKAGMTAPQVANYCGYRADSNNRDSTRHRTYDVLVQETVRLHREGHLIRQAIDGGSLRVIYAYSLKEAAA